MRATRSPEPASVGEAVVHPSRHGPTRVELRGEFDLDDTAWCAAVDELIHQGWAELELDLAEVLFADSTFVRDLYRLHHHAKACGGAVSVVGASPLMMRILTVTGIAELVGAAVLGAPDT